MTARAAAIVLGLLLAMPAWAGDIRPFGPDSWAALRAGHAGRPLVVHLWSLTCAPCLAELPQWGRVKDVDLVLVSTDPIEQAPRMAATLHKAGLDRVESWAFADPFTERLRFQIDRRWRGELPRTLLIGPDGATEMVSGTMDPERLSQWLARQEPPHASRP